MKNFSTSISLIVAILLGLSVFAQGQTLQAVFNEGVALYNQQDYRAALQKFERVLQTKPGFVYARNYAGKCRAEIAKGAGPKNDTEAVIAKIIIPEINVTDAPIGDVLDYLSDRAGELSGGKVVPNFIYEGSSEQRQNTLISLSLRNVPMTEAIRYVGQLSRTDFRYDPHAIVATPRGSQSANISAESVSVPQEKSGTTFEKPVKSIFD
ncbi:MAG: tetratricopeptide repeat protein [Verrucomicrobiales bacterium]|nr:tetratricopeptide repeat protein [Verrucomicrobiales bacterium]